MNHSKRLAKKSTNWTMWISQLSRKRCLLTCTLWRSISSLTIEPFLHWRPWIAKINACLSKHPSLSTSFRSASFLGNYLIYTSIWLHASYFPWLCVYNRRWMISFPLLCVSRRDAEMSSGSITGAIVRRGWQSWKSSIIITKSPTYVCRPAVHTPSYFSFHFEWVRAQCDVSVWLLFFSAEKAV